MRQKRCQVPIWQFILDTFSRLRMAFQACGKPVESLATQELGELDYEDTQ